MSDENFDQTSFVDHTSLSAEATLPTDVHPRIEEKVVTPKKKLNPIFIIVSILVGVVLLSLVLAVFTTSSSTSQLQPTPSAIPSSSPGVVGPMQATINQLKKNVQYADPQNNDLPFPPVNFSLHLNDPNALSNQ
ncbi:hypothetical protein C5B42_05795 [Candidatus Cerribacteria bacterium 'Amazon FNV 2010 28 9']|uniref:Uncharacterized protein n=1 Tax=Candidatus Cerribacteria bacterium 'Amazon FNV 2010 28 9' TaxID=2081795 RepID=A0A317JNI0_9BACT|nr:MAG: hypothetical protein C5B42_05795 [Candidatus Cerribacteria bacterium 'Amazon FNV 2010 28 9']